MPRKTAVFRLLSGLRDSERGRGMRFTPSIFGKLLEPIKRRQFDTLVARHAGDAYVKAFPSGNHLLALVYAQFAAAVSLRGLEAGWNANRQHHYHLGSDPLVRSTLCDANKRRPVALFAETFSLVASQLDRQTRRDGAAMVKLIVPPPLSRGQACMGLLVSTDLTWTPFVRSAGRVWVFASSIINFPCWPCLPIVPRRDQGFWVMIRGELAIRRGTSRHTLVFGGSIRFQTMMQSCASAAKLRDGRPIL